MDIQEHSTQVMEELRRIEGQLTSLRYTFGIVIIILTVLFAAAAPVIVRLVSDTGSTGSPEATEPGALQGTQPAGDNGMAPAVGTSMEAATGTEGTPQ